MFSHIFQLYFHSSPFRTNKDLAKYLCNFTFCPPVTDSLGVVIAPTSNQIMVITVSIKAMFGDKNAAWMECLQKNQTSKQIFLQIGGLTFSKGFLFNV